MFELILFWLFAVGAVGTASMVVLPPMTRNPVYAALSLVISFFFVAGLYVLLFAHLLAVLQILVYAGAIMVLFLFVIMLLNLEEGELGRQTTSWVQLAGAGAAVFIGVKAAILVTYSADNVPAGGVPPEALALSTSDFGTVHRIGDTLFRQYLVPFELTGILLLVAVVGAVVLAKRRL